MRNLYSKYKQFFCVPADGKVSEKTMMRRIALSIAVAVICMGAMSISAYAFVTWNVTSGVNVIKSAHFDMKIVNNQTLDSLDEAKRCYKLVADENENTTFVFTLSYDIQCDATAGFGKVIFYCDENMNDSSYIDTYYTKPIKAAGDTQRIVEIVVPAGKTAYVEFVPEWGTYSGTGDGIKLIEGKIELNAADLPGTNNVDEEVQEEQASGEQSGTETQVTDSEQSGDSGDQQETQATESTETAQPDQPADNTEQEQQTEPTEPTDATEPTDGETTDATEDLTTQEDNQAITPTE